MKSLAVAIFFTALATGLSAQHTICEMVASKDVRGIGAAMDSALITIDHEKYQQGLGFNQVVDHLVIWVEGFHCVRTVEHDYLYSVDISDPAVFSMTVEPQDPQEESFIVNFEIRPDRLHFQSILW